jgi:hypothetical protein
MDFIAQTPGRFDRLFAGLTTRACGGRLPLQHPAPTRTAGFRQIERNDIRFPVLPLHRPVREGVGRFPFRH